MRLFRRQTMTVFEEEHQMEYLKKASNSAEQHANAARKVVEEVLKDIRERGEDAVRDLAKKFDHWDQD
ncbi:MAG: histidinol dehydrogenase, partial [Mailhella sp.]|nr:histidinol dehydrogenase [Mailhella sp.]